MFQLAEVMMRGHTGRDLYARNLKLLVPFFDSASIVLLKIEKVDILCKLTFYTSRKNQKMVPAWDGYPININPWCFTHDINS